MPDRFEREDIESAALALLEAGMGAQDRPAVAHLVRKLRDRGWMRNPDWATPDEIAESEAARHAFEDAIAP